MKILTHEFYNRHSKVVAQDLLGKILIVEKAEGRVIGRIVETESYHQEDPSSHSFGGEKIKNRAMFGEAGHAYIYFTYGMYFCFNVVTGEVGVGDGVLIRALEPVEGIALMRKRRKCESIYNLCSGPAKLVIAMGITKDDYGSSLTSGPIKIYDIKDKDFEIVKAKRVGISKSRDLLLRFYIKDNQYISKK